ncbi:MAG: PEP-CTERM sorting domain-containing protein [Verrucomicrobiales bacterium]|nr:PEP-CTERM sorting domain-containing protein [Verrucomicrobiales bacterium]MCP5525781.1 PEP-CTERM sorting domain-containing protein [Verrucomicrobiales bacterium]
MRNWKLNISVAVVAVAACGTLQAAIKSAASLAELESIYEMVPYPNADGNPMGPPGFEVLVTDVISPVGWDDLTIDGSGMFRWQAIPDHSFGYAHWLFWDATTVDGIYDGPVYSNQDPKPLLGEPEFIGTSFTLQLPANTLAFYLHAGPGGGELMFAVSAGAEVVAVKGEAGKPGFFGFYSDDPGVFLQSVEVDIGGLADTGFGIGQFGIGNVMVPEPGAWAGLAGTGLLGFAAWRRRRRA